MSEVVEVCERFGFTPTQQLLSDLITLAENIFEGFGQTKVVEDHSQKLADLSDRSSKSKVLKTERVYSKASDSEILAMHQRKALETPPGGFPDARLPKNVFNPSKHRTSVDAPAILGQATWPIFNPQSYKSLSAGHHLLRFLRETDSWEYAGQAWMSQLLQLGIVLALADDHYVVSLGPVCSLAAVAWPLQRRCTSKNTYFTLGEECARGAARLERVVCTDFDRFQVVPTEVVAPIGMYVNEQWKVQGFQGVCLRETGTARPLLTHAALNCFWTLGLPVLQRIAGDQGIPEAIRSNEYSVLVALVRKILACRTEAEIAEVLCGRGQVPADEIPECLKTDVVASVFEKDDLDSIQGFRWG